MDDEKIATTTHEKLMTKTIVHFPIVEVNDHTLVIDENGTDNTTSIQKATLALGRHFASLPSSERSLFSRAQEWDSKKTPAEYAVDRIAQNPGKEKSLW